MLIGNTAEKSLPDTLSNLYHGEKMLITGYIVDRLALRTLYS
jgi:hypothetical protein